MARIGRARAWLSPKDKVENFLHRQVCSGRMSLTEAQRQIATDWIVVWRRIEGQAAVKGVGEDEGDGRD
jgi:hypothetical protein